MSGQFQAFILNTGELVKLSKDDTIETAPSQGLVDDKFTEMYKSGVVIKPPYDPNALVDMVDSNTYHFRCSRQKAIDIAGLGFDIVTKEKDVDKKSVLENRRQDLLKFFLTCNKKETFNEVATKAWTDFESVGWLAIEVTRTRANKPVGLYHIPAHTVRYKSDGTGLIQQRQTKKGIEERHFKWFNDTEARIDPNTSKKMTEVIYMVNYSPKSDHYGVPDHIPAAGAMVGNNYARDYNINFFGNNAVPQYAVILEGGELTPDIETKIKEHFRNNLKGNHNSHRTLVLTTPEGGKINFQALAIDVKEGHFRLYRKDNRDEVIHAHGIPPYRIGVVEAGTLGGNIASETTKIYKYSIIQPRQQRLESRFQKVLIDGFGENEFEFKFNEIDTDDQKMIADIEFNEAQTAKIWLDAGVITPNEARKDYLGKESFPEDMEWGEEVLPIVRLASNPAWLEANKGDLGSGTEITDIVGETKTPSSEVFSEIKGKTGGGGGVKKAIAKTRSDFKAWRNLTGSSQSA